MTISYFRKTQKKVEEAIEAVKAHAKEKGYTLLGEMELPKTGGRLITVCDPKWIDEIVSKENALIGFIPCSVLVMEKEGQVIVGSGNPQILGNISRTPELGEVIAEMDEAMRSLVEAAAGVGPLKPAKVKLYATTSCPYCKMEKAYLEEKKIDFEEVMVDQDRAAGEEMVRKTGQMGVPVTEIEYEEGDPEFIIGFDKPHLNQILGIK